jgi:RNA polymerase sigma-70 factor (ECF subfamily)
MDRAEDMCRRYYPLIYRYVAFRVNGREDAEDIVSDVFLKVLGSKRVSFGLSRDIRPLLFTAAKHLVIDYYRMRARRTTVDSEQDIELVIDPASSSEQATNDHDLRQSLSRLTTDQYMVVFLRFIERYSIQEASEIMKKRPGSIKALQFRALQSLRSFLKEDSLEFK